MIISIFDTVAVYTWLLSYFVNGDDSCFDYYAESETEAVELRERADSWLTQLANEFDADSAEIVGIFNPSTAEVESHGDAEIEDAYAEPYFGLPTSPLYSDSRGEVIECDVLFRKDVQHIIDQVGSDLQRELEYDMDLGYTPWDHDIVHDEVRDDLIGLGIPTNEVDAIATGIIESVIS